MPWYNRLFILLLLILTLATPFAVAAGAYSWFRIRSERGWRAVVSGTGVIYSAAVFGGMIAYAVATPRYSIAVQSAYVESYGRMLAHASLGCFGFALLGLGRARIAFALVGAAGIAFALLRFLTF